MPRAAIIQPDQSYNPSNAAGDYKPLALSSLNFQRNQQQLPSDAGSGLICIARS